MLRKLLLVVVLLVLAVALVGVSFGAGVGASRLIFQPRANQVNDGAPADFSSSMAVFWEAWNIVNKEFYKQPLDPTKMTYGAIAGMVDALGDPHTAFVDPTQARIINQDLQGSFEGIGATVQMNQGRLTVVAPIKGSPAEKAGIKAGDVILKVDDTAIVNMTVDQAIALIRGPKGSTVHLQVQRGTQPVMAINIVRDTIPVNYVDARMLDNNIAYLKLSEFSATAPDELHKDLLDLMAQKPKALILDLRNNPGGYLDAAVKIAGEFLPSGSVVLIEKDKNGNQQEYRTDAQGQAADPGLKMVLLVNEESASASEILSGALKDYKRATIIGTNTYGKGSVQTPHTLSDQSQLRVTIAHFFSPQNHEINGVGVKPDIEVADPTAAQLAQNQDPQLDRAVQFLSNTAQLDFGWVLQSLLAPAWAELPL